MNSSHSTELKKYINKRRGLTQKKRKILIVSNLLLAIGIIMMLSTSIYLIVNLSRLDSIIDMCKPFLGIGVFLTYMSLIISWNYMREEKSVFQFDYLLLGIIATTLLVFLFKRKTPDIPIGLNRQS
jgi:cell division protein FtsW (lipid II flippase)